MSRRKTLLLGAGAALLPLASIFPRRAGAAEFPGVAEALPNPAYPNGGNIRPLPQDGAYPVTWWGARADNGATDNAAAFEGFSDFLRLSRDAPGYIPGSDGAYGVSRPFPIYSGTSWIGDGPARSRIINSTRNKGQFWSNGVAYLGTFFARGPTKIGPQSPFDMIPVAGQALFEPGSTSITALGGVWQVGDVVLIEDIARRGKTRYANYAGLNSVVRVDGLRLELKYPVDVALPQGAKLYRMPRDPADSFASFLAVNPHWKGRPSFLTQGAAMKGLFLGQIDGPTAEAPAQTLHVACYECTLEDVAVEGSFTAIGGNPFARNMVRGCSFTSQWRAAELAYVTGHNTLIDTRCTVVDGRMSGDRGSGFTLRLSSEDMFGNNLVQGGVLEWRRTDEGGKSPAVDLHGDGDRMENVQVIAGVKPLAIGLVGDGGVIRNCTISGGTALAISSTRGDPVIEGNRISPEARRVASIRMRDRGGRIQSNVLGDGTHPSHVIDVENFDAFDSGALDVSGNEGGYYSNLRSGSSLTETVQGTRIVAQATSPGERLNRRSRASGTIAFSCDAGQAGGEKQFFVRINGADSAPVTLPAGQTGSFTFRMTTSEVAVDSIRVDLAIDGAAASRSDTLQVRTRGGPVTVELGIAMSGGALTLSRREVGFVSPQLHLRTRPKKGQATRA